MRKLAILGIVGLLAACDGKSLGFLGANPIPKNQGSETPQASGSTSPANPAATPTPIPEYPPFPMIEGASLTYKLYTYSSSTGAGVFSGQVALKIMSVERSNSEATASIRGTMTDTSGKETIFDQLQIKTLNGWYWSNGGDRRKYDDVPLSMAAGTVLLTPATQSHVTNASGTYDGYDSDQNLITALGVSVTTDAGKFENCAKVTSFKTYKLIEHLAQTQTSLAQTRTTDGTSSTTVWIAPNVGMIKRESLIESRLRGVASGGLSTAWADNYDRQVQEISTYSVPLR